jgi:Tol biopolymer transport system component
LGLAIADVEKGERREFFHSYSTSISWSPDGSRLALDSFGACAPLLLFHADGSGEEELDIGCDPNGDVRSLSWSPDGRKIAFVVNVFDGTTDTNVLSVVDLATPGLSSPPPGCAFQDPTSVSWSPDGSRMAVAAGGIFVLNLATGTCTRLTEFPLDDEPSWSPDGTRIAFASIRDGNGEIYVMNADGSNQMRITHQRAAFNQQPSWRP